MDLNKAIITRILELIEQYDITITQLSLNANLTPSTLFDIINDKHKNTYVLTIKKICGALNITLKEFFSPDYFNNFDDIYNI